MIPNTLPAFPEELRIYLGEEDAENVSGRSDAVTWHTGNGFYIKTGQPGTLAREYEMTCLFHRLGIGPEAMRYLSADRDYLVTRKAEGIDLTKCHPEPEPICILMAEALRDLHAQPVTGIPVSKHWLAYEKTAQMRMEECGWNEYLRMQRFPFASRLEAWETLQEHRHLLSCDTLIHGDACLPNLMQKDGRFTGFIDTGLAGIGDRSIDLFWALWSLQYNLHTDCTDLFLDHYGRESGMEARLRVIAAFELFL